MVKKLLNYKNIQSHFQKFQNLILSKTKYLNNQYNKVEDWNHNKFLLYILDIYDVDAIAKHDNQQQLKIQEYLSHF